MAFLQDNLVFAVLQVEIALEMQCLHWQQRTLVQGTKCSHLNQLELVPFLQVALHWGVVLLVELELGGEAEQSLAHQVTGPIEEIQVEIGLHTRQLTSCKELVG